MSAKKSRPANVEADQINSANRDFWDQTSAAFNQLVGDTGANARFDEVAAQVNRHLRAGHTAEPSLAENTGLEAVLMAV